MQSNFDPIFWTKSECGLTYDFYHDLHINLHIISYLQSINHVYNMGKKCGMQKCNFILTFAITKVRYGIMTAKICVKDLLFLVVYKQCNDALKITLVKTSIKHTLNKVFKPSNFY